MAQSEFRGSAANGRIRGYRDHAYLLGNCTFLASYVFVSNIEQRIIDLQTLGRKTAARLPSALLR